MYQIASKNGIFETGKENQEPPHISGQGLSVDKYPRINVRQETEATVRFGKCFVSETPSAAVVIAIVTITLALGELVGLMFSADCRVTNQRLDEYLKASDWYPSISD